MAGGGELEGGARPARDRERARPHTPTCTMAALSRHRVARTLCCAAIVQVLIWMVIAWFSLKLLCHVSSCAWLPYVLPFWHEVAWNGFVHTWKMSGGNGTVGSHHNEMLCYVDAFHANYTSLLDVACSSGLMLARLQRSNPHAAFFGTDISTKMVSATQRRCPSCHTAQYDLARLLHRGGDGSGPLGAVGNTTTAVDVVLVIDVLDYMPFAGVPPALLKAQLVPSTMLRAAQRQLFNRLTSLARREVVFSDHSGDAAVVDFLKAMGAKPRPRRDGSGALVWVARGTASGGCSPSASSPVSSKRRSSALGSSNRSPSWDYRACIARHAVGHWHDVTEHI